MFKALFLIFTLSCTLLSAADPVQERQLEQKRLQRQREDADRLKQQVEQTRLQSQREDADRLEREREKERVKSQIEEDTKKLYDYEDEELYRQEILEDEPINR